MAVKKVNKKLESQDVVFSKHIGLFVLRLSSSGVELDFFDKDVKEYLNNLYEPSLNQLGNLFFSKVELETNKKGNLPVNQNTLDFLSGLFVSCLNSLPFHLRSMLGRQKL